MAAQEGLACGSEDCFSFTALQQRKCDNLFSCGKKGKSV